MFSGRSKIAVPYEPDVLAQQDLTSFGTRIKA